MQILNSIRLAGSVFGNYIVQRLLEFGSEKQLFAPPAGFADALIC